MNHPKWFAAEIESDTVYCQKNAEECAEKGMTRNSKHNRLLSVSCRQNAVPSSSTLTLYSHGGFCWPRGWQGLGGWADALVSFHSTVTADP